jgi:NADPH:quinone reductase-like Zn-dependent oxidoreductase
MFRRRILTLPSCATRVHLFSTSAQIQANRAVIYSQNGPPADVVRALTIPSLTTPASPQTVNVRFVLSPINPADVNVIEGVYPSKPQPSSFPGVRGDVFVGGNEGLAEVTDVGEGVRNLQCGDWVVMKASQVGTWRTAANLREEQLLKVPRLEGLSEVNAATMMVRSFASSILRLAFRATFTYRRLTPQLHTAFCRTSFLWRGASGSFKTARTVQCVIRVVRREMNRSSVCCCP